MDIMQQINGLLFPQVLLKGYAAVESTDYLLYLILSKCCTKSALVAYGHIIVLKTFESSRWDFTSNFVWRKKITCKSNRNNQ